jgi:hypothetical protein
MAIPKCDVIVEESQKIIFLVSHSTPNIVDCEKHEDLDRFFNIPATNLPDFSAARLFSINRPTILSILGTVTSPPTVLVTFDPTQPNCIANPNLTET